MLDGVKILLAVAIGYAVAPQPHSAARDEPIVRRAARSLGAMYQACEETHSPALIGSASSAPAARHDVSQVRLRWCGANILIPAQVPFLIKRMRRQMRARSWPLGSASRRTAQIAATFFPNRCQNVPPIQVPLPLCLCARTA